jgi:outer membrane protein assembly factor BamA
MPRSNLSVSSLLFLVLMHAFVPPAFPQEEPEPVKKENKLFFLPIIFWTPATQLMYGFSAGYAMYKPFRDSTPSPSVISAYVVHTQKNQSSITLGYETHWNKDRLHFKTSVGYSEWYDLFFGIGNNTPDSVWEENKFTPRTYSFRGRIAKTIRPYLQVGLAVEYDQSRIVEKEDDGYFVQRNIPGEKPGRSSGAGVIADYDSRDSRAYPTRGWYQQFSLIPFHRVIGSDYNFVRFVADVRQYFSPFEKHVIAYQAYASLIGFHPPYYKMSLFGSDGLMRGYYPSRYRDRNMIAAQAEYRMPLFWRLSASGFGGYGDVAHDITDFRLKDLKYSVGFGIRYTIDPIKQTLIRLDIAVGKNSAYPTIAIGEAF